MLQNKTILITGSSRGIGAAIAILAKSYGADIILHGKTESNELKKLASKLEAPYFFCDLTDENTVMKKIKKLKKVDILVNNAGINPSKTFLDLTLDEWRLIHEVNVLGVVSICKAIIPKMIRKHKGKIINITSIKGFSHVSGKPAYASSKAEIIRITSSMAEELAPYNILVNAVAPGFTSTEMTKSTLSPKIQSQIKKIPLKRMADPVEIAEAVLFLGSDKANYITGQTIVVDGGYTINN